MAKTKATKTILYEEKKESERQRQLKYELQWIKQSYLKTSSQSRNKAQVNPYEALLK